MTSNRPTAARQLGVYSVMNALQHNWSAERLMPPKPTSWLSTDCQHAHNTCKQTTACLLLLALKTHTAGLALAAPAAAFLHQALRLCILLPTAAAAPTLLAAAPDRAGWERGALLLKPLNLLLLVVVHPGLCAEGSIERESSEGQCSSQNDTSSAPAATHTQFPSPPLSAAELRCCCSSCCTAAGSCWPGT